MKRRTRPPLADHLMESSIPVPFSGCWLWLLSLDRDGYGRCSLGPKFVNAHRLSWTAFRGPIPFGMHVLHTCDIPSCINPDHLWLGTHLDNMRDRSAKGRSRNAFSANRLAA